MFDFDLDSSGGFAGDAPYAGDPFYEGLNALYRKYYDRDVSEAELNAHRGNPGGLSAIEQALKKSLESPTPPPANPNPQITGTGGTGDGTGHTPTNGSFGSLLQPFGETFTKPSTSNAVEQFPDVPVFHAPDLPTLPTFRYKDFEAPTASSVYDDPSYQLREKEGADILLNRAASLGKLRGGATLKDLLKYNQAFASGEYGNMYNRKLTEHQLGFDEAARTFATNTANTFGSYDRAMDAAVKTFEPKMEQYRLVVPAVQRQSELDYDRDWQKFLQDYRMFDENRKWIYDVLADQQRIGLGAAG